MNAIDRIENEAREASRTTHGYAQTVIGAECDIIECQVISSMVNRGMATGLCYKATWKINGKRASRDAVYALAGAAA